MVKIEDREVTENDIGAVVTYFGHPNEVGTISSFSEDRIWVKFRGPTGELCSQFRLRWGDCTRGKQEVD